MRLSEIYSNCRMKENTDGVGCAFMRTESPVISFEIFPPKNDEAGEKLDKLIEHLAILKNYNPAFISLTYGAGGTTQSSSLGIIKRVQNELNLNVMPHFTCVGAKKAQIKEYLKEITDLGIKNILALRGDIPEGSNIKDFDFHYANELVKFIKSETNLSIGVAGYPEGHIACDDFFMDLDNLKHKVDEGADVIYTQMFFDNDKFFRFVQLARAAGIQIPIIPGILPISSYGQLDKMLSMARVSVPQSLKNSLEKFKDNPEDVKKLGVEFATSQCQELIDADVCGLHFYSLNSSIALTQILDNLSISQLVS